MENHILKYRDLNRIVSRVNRCMPNINSQNNGLVVTKPVTLMTDQAQHGAQLAGQKKKEKQLCTPNATKGAVADQLVCNLYSYL